MKVTLQVNGREMTFTEQKLIAIVEKHFSKKVTTAKVAKVPTEGQWFEITPQSIDQDLFKEKKEDSKQEATRELILEAFEEMKNNPKKYGKKFKTMMPKKDWPSKTVAELKAMACELGDHNADWVEQALEWAQRIANGEGWKTICNDADTANLYRLVVWKNGYDRFVGGSVDRSNDDPASVVHYYYCTNNRSLDFAVPLVVDYDEETSAA